MRKDSGIETLQDLAGKTIAFEDPFSTSGYLLPTRAIESAGLRLEAEAHAQSDASLRYRFSGSEQNSSALLFRGSVDAIALSDYDWLRANHVPDNQRTQCAIIHVSEPVPRAIELVRATMPEAEKQALRSFMLRMHLNPAQENALEDYHDTGRFPS